jgi:hypothetical protein
VGIVLKDGPELNGVTEIAQLTPLTTSRHPSMGVILFASVDAARAAGSRDATGRTFVRSTSRFYEALKYVVFFPTGCGGWGLRPPNQPDRLTGAIPKTLLFVHFFPLWRQFDVLRLTVAIRLPAVRQSPSYPSTLFWGFGAYLR